MEKSVVKNVDGSATIMEGSKVVAEVPKEYAHEAQAMAMSTELIETARAIADGLSTFKKSAEAKGIGHPSTMAAWDKMRTALFKMKSQINGGMYSPEIMDSSKRLTSAKGCCNE